METRAHHILIGLFAVLTVTAAILFGLWLGKSGHDKAFNDYDIIFEEAVQGLSQGSAVQFNGIRVGDVLRLRLDPRDPRRVLARIRVSAETPVTTTSRASLMMAGVTGLSTIQLVSGDTQGERLVPAEGEEVASIVADPSPFSRLLTGGEDIMLNLNHLVRQARDIFSPDNVAALGQTLKNLEALTETLNAQGDDVRLALRAVSGASQEASAALREASRLLASVNRMLDEQGDAAFESTRQAMATLESTLATLDRLVSDNRDQLDSSLKGLTEVGPALQELRSTLTALRALTRRIDEDPPGFLLGRERNQEFKP